MKFAIYTSSVPLTRDELNRRDRKMGLFEIGCHFFIQNDKPVLACRPLLRRCPYTTGPSGCVAVLLSGPQPSQDQLTKARLLIEDMGGTVNEVFSGIPEVPTEEVRQWLQHTEQDVKQNTSQSTETTPRS